MYVNIDFQAHSKVANHRLHATLSADQMQQIIASAPSEAKLITEPWQPASISKLPDAIIRRIYNALRVCPPIDDPALIFDILARRRKSIAAIFSAKGTSSMVHDLLLSEPMPFERMDPRWLDQLCLALTCKRLGKVAVDIGVVNGIFTLQYSDIEKLEFLARLADGWDATHVILCTECTKFAQRELGVLAHVGVCKECQMESRKRSPAWISRDANDPMDGLSD
ncbi:MAG: hypothetical protein Q9160_001923 [Pyrenula sp. 1 TL-2023]